MDKPDVRSLVEMPVETLGDRIRQTLADRGKKQKDLAALFHVTPSTVSQWLRNETLMDVETLGKIADFLNVSTDYLLGRQNEARMLVDRMKAASELDPEFWEIWQAWAKEEKLRIAFTLMKEARPETLDMMLRIIKAIETEERVGNERHLGV